MHKSWLEQDEGGRFQVHSYCGNTEETLRSDPGSWRKDIGHSAYYAGLVKEQGERMKGADQKEAFERIACDFENIRLAWRCLVEEEQEANQGYAVWALPLRYGLVGIPSCSPNFRWPTSHFVTQEAGVEEEISPGLSPDADRPPAPRAHGYPLRRR